jgi:hypothetical protein
MAGVRYLIDLPGTRRPHKRRLRVSCRAADCARSHALIQGEGRVFCVDCSFVLEICANDKKLESDTVRLLRVRHSAAA